MLQLQKHHKKGSAPNIHQGRWLLEKLRKLNNEVEYVIQMAMKMVTSAVSE